MAHIPHNLITHSTHTHAVHPTSTQTHVTHLTPGGYDPELEAAAQAGELGTPLLPSDAALLSLRPLRRYCAGELVAYSPAAVAATAPHLTLTTPSSQPTSNAHNQIVVDPGVAAALAAERRVGAAGSVPGSRTADRQSNGPAPPGQTPGQTSPPEGAQPVLCYGRVASDAAPTASNHQPLYRISIEVEPGTFVQLLSTQVYCFRPPSEADAMRAAPQARLQVTGAPAVQPGSGSTTVAPTTNHPSNTSAAGSTSSTYTHGVAPGPGPASRAAGAVGAAELVGAVRELLAAAGLPADLGSEALVSTAAGLRAELGAAQEALSQVCGI